MATPRRPNPRGDQANMSVENMSEEDLEASLDKRKLPQHVAITMDGNGRWATRRNLPRTAGHRASIDAVRDSVEICGELGIRVLTLYTFSSENWKRPIREVNALMRLLLEQLQQQTPELVKNDVQLRVMGEIDRLPNRVVRELERSIGATKNSTGLTLNLALNYGGRQEIVQAVRSLITDVEEGKIKSDDINEKVFAQYLYTSDLPDPDLLIRTGSMMRISNFFLWQLSYTEIYVTDVLWPDFRKKDLLIALLAYQERERRFGGI
jgi:undecaprenyl diphosphate synthase